MGNRYERRCTTRQNNQTDLVKRTDIPVNMVVPLVHPAAGDSIQTGTVQQFADINKGLIVQGLEVWSEENKDEV